MSSVSVHDEWLSLIEVSGPFLAVPVLKEVFPQGLEELDSLKRKRLRQAYEEWREALETDDPQFSELHAAWIDEVLSRGLELDEDGTGDTLKRGDHVPASLRVTLPEHDVTLAPDLAVVDSSQGDKPLMLIHIYAADIDLEGSIKQDGWVATPVERMVQLCRMTGCRIGLITNGERWILVDAPVGGVTTIASWYARIWGQEPITLQAFVHLLGIRRFFFDQSEQLPALFDRSLKYQDEVTEALGEQVRRAVEVLIQSLDKADQDRNRELLHDVAPTELYEAGLTVMMRLVFLLSAEERGLLLMGDERYEANYALSTLRMQLRSESEEILERRWDAWSRLLAIFRAVFGGIEHENMRMPALGGSLFDPDRFPFLEGRNKGSNWHTDIAKPLPIDNRTVLLLLDAIQQFQGRTLSYRALDVEQIGYVYEGLLERTVKRTSEVTLELDATKSAKNPWITLGEIESAGRDGAAQLAALLQERSGCSASRIRNDIAKTVDDAVADRLLTACQGNTALRDRIKPYAYLLRTDPWGYPLVYPKGAFIVTTGSNRRETGTHYTPKSLTEAIVAETLTPIAYVGPAEGKPRKEWILKSPAELLDLKICDPAMGSGAFLVQTCRWLSDRLVEAWSLAETNGQFVTVDGDVATEAGVDEPLPRDAEARTVIARRLIAERCLYGVDLNPLAVELAKLSIWLVTLAKERPFGFLDHNLRCGDSLLGIHRLDQLTELCMNPGRANIQMRVFGRNIEQAVREAIELRQRLREMPIRDIHDVEAMARLDTDARCRLEVPERIADAFIGEVFRIGSKESALDTALASLAIQAEQAIDGDHISITNIVKMAISTLSADLPAGKSIRRPFHWPLEFPEVFSGPCIGFNAVVGNPPFLGGLRITETSGAAYGDYLALVFGGNNKVDFCAFFFKRAFALLSPFASMGLLATNTISQGVTRKHGLSDLIVSGASIYSARPNFQWPGHASVFVAMVHIFKGGWVGQRLIDGQPVQFINDLLVESSGLEESPKKLFKNAGLCFQGSNPLGEGFFLDEVYARQLIAIDSINADVVKPVLGGKELNQLIDLDFPRWIIDFGEMSLDQVKCYSAPYSHVLTHVKPDRETKDGSKYPRMVYEWWKFWHSRNALYDGIRKKKLQRVLVRARVSDYHILEFLPPGQHEPGAEFGTTTGRVEPESDSADEIDAASNQSLVPSSLGLTFCVDGEVNQIELEVRWGRYERSEEHEIFRTRKNKETDTEEQTKAKVWQRIPCGGKLVLPLAEGVIPHQAPDKAYPEVRVQGSIRAKNANGDRLVTLFLVNTQEEPETNRDTAWVFQPEVIVRAVKDAGTRSIFRRRPVLDSDGMDPEREALEMIYRNRVEFAVGHGVAVHAETSEDVTLAIEVRTVVMPQYEVQITETPGLDPMDRPAMKEIVSSGLLDMQRLATLESNALVEALSVLTKDYAAWIDEQRARVGNDVVGYDAQSQQAMDRCQDIYERLQQGIDTLKNDKKALAAFRFANQAMATQRVRSLYALAMRRGEEVTVDSFDVLKNRSWRPFQLAFLLLSIPSLADLNHPDRVKPVEAYADLLWFPTGGGKTEAYLGVAAFTMAIRRMQGNLGGYDSSRGLAVIMRYTLRLLTLQQFQRATALICAMEALRREALDRGDESLGTEPLTIGLWVGT